MEKQYAIALFELAQKPDAKAETLVQKLREHLKEVGREKLLPRILREFSKLDALATAFGESLEVASQDEKAHAEKEAHALGITAHAHVNHDLVSGWRARKGSRVIDRSGKRALIDLYRQIAQNA